MRSGMIRPSIFMALIGIFCTLSSTKKMTCPDDPCICEHGEVLCICNQNGVRENVTFDNMVKLGDWRSITVEHCDVVEVKFGAFSFVPSLDSVTFHDVKTLIIQGDAFNGIVELHTVNISQIESFRPDRHVFYKIGNISNFFLTDVKASILPTGFLGASHCHMLMLSDMDVQSVDQRAFFFQHVGHVAVSKSRFETIHSTALEVEQSAIGILLQSINVGTTEFDSMIFNDITSHLIVQDCVFDTIQPSFIIARSAKCFSFKRNVVGYCESNSFDAIVVRSQVSFTNNVFKNALDQCLRTGFPASTLSTLTGNHFNCDCDLEWFYKNDYDRVYGNSTCTLNYDKINLDRTEVINDAKGECYQVALISDKVTFIPEPRTDVTSRTSSMRVTRPFQLLLFLLSCKLLKIK